MLRPVYTKRFSKDVKRQKRRGKDLDKLKEIMTLLIQEENMPSGYSDHPLIGNLKDFRECHIEPDWLLMYKVQGSEIYFTRTGSHADLFG